MTRKLTTNQSVITEERVLRGSSRGSRTYVLLILEVSINNLSGTDGCRVRCRQFSTSSKSPQVPSRASCKKCSQQWMLSQFQNNEGLAPKTYLMVFQSMNGTSFLPGLLVMNRTAPLRKITRSQEKPSAGSSRQLNRPAKRCNHCRKSRKNKSRAVLNINRAALIISSDKQ